MPTNTELNALGRSDLANAVSKRGGFQAWANKLNAKRAHSDSDTGWDGEIALAKILTEKGFIVERSEGVKAPFDLTVNGVVRIDVKSARYAEYGACRGWFYRVGKVPQADVMAFFQLDTSTCYFVPWDKCPRSNVTIARDGGKYATFRDRYDLLATLCAKRSSEATVWN